MKRMLGCLAALAWAAVASAETKTQEVTVAAGKHDRQNTPVHVGVLLPESLAKVQVVSLQNADLRPFPGQLTQSGLLGVTPPVKPGMVYRELHFVLPSLKAGASVSYQVTVSTDTPVPSKAFAWSEPNGEVVELHFDQRPVLRYMYKALDDSSKEAREQTYKVFHHLYDPEGKRLVTKGPGGKYTHHRGLYYGFNKITLPDGKPADIWHCTGDTHQAQAEFLLHEAGPVLARQRLAINWNGPEKKIFAREARELTVYHVPGGTLVEFASRLLAVPGPVKLDGDPQHAGFHFRADNEVADKTSKETYYVRPDGPGKPGETRNWPMNKDHVNLPWNAMSFVLGGQRYTAAYLDQPTNPKEARFSERDYGRFGSYFAYELTKDKPLEVNYRVWLQKGEMKGADVAALDANFVEPPLVTVK